MFRFVSFRFVEYHKPKNHNTLKSLLGINGNGVINFVSCLEGGFISDRDLTVKSGILTKDWHKEDVLMADRGFEIQDDLAPLGGNLTPPPLSEKEMSVPRR